MSGGKIRAPLWEPKIKWAPRGLTRVNTVSIKATNWWFNFLHEWGKACPGTPKEAIKTFRSQKQKAKRFKRMQWLVLENKESGIFLRPESNLLTEDLQFTVTQLISFMSDSDHLPPPNLLLRSGVWAPRLHQIFDIVNREHAVFTF